MSDTNNAPANTGKTAAASQEPAQPDLSKMTGEEAKAYVEAQKAAKADKSKPITGKPQAPAKSNPVEANKEAIKEAVAEAKKYKVKVDGNELEVDEKELLRGYSHQRAANKILQEGKAARKQAEEFIEIMKDKGKLMDVLKKLGHDPRKLSEEYLAAQLEEELLDPRDKELKQAKAKLQQIEEMERKQREAVEKQRNDELKAKYAKEYETQFVDALKQSNLPPTKGMVAEMAKYISRSAKIGFKMTPSEAAQLVKEDVQRAQMSLIGTADGETLLKLLGDEVAAKLLQARGKQVKQPEQVLKTPTEQGEPSQRVKASGKRMSSREWREFNRKK